MQRALAAPLRPQPITPTVLAPRLASARVASAAEAPVRSAVTARASMIASGAPLVASQSTTTPLTVGTPPTGLAGNELTHFSSATPSPRAGIARKSPCGGLGR